MKTKLFFILFLIVISQQLKSQGIDPVLSAKLQHTLDSMRTSSQCVKGISAGVYVPGEGTWLGVSGVSHENVNVTPGMRFGIASQTKTYISVLMLKLAEMNVLSLDDRIDKWLPNFQYIDPSITIRQLLNHTSGVFNFREHKNMWGKMYSNPRKIWTPEEVLTTFVSEPYFAPGQGWHYSNTNYVLAGMIIKAATGSSVSSNLRQLILNPLGLNDTYFSVEENVPDTVSHRWWNCADESHLSFNSWCSSFSSAAAIFSTAENNIRWYRDIFGGQILNQSSLNQFFNFVTTGQSDLPYYGLGMVRIIINGRVEFGHGGSFIYRSLTQLDSSSGVITSVLINGTDVVHNNSFFLDLTLALLGTALNNSGDNSPAIVNGNGFSSESFYSHENQTNSIEASNGDELLPMSFQLFQNYPNPFNPKTIINYELRITSYVSLKVYDGLGKEVETLVNKELNPGSYEVDFDGGNYPSGIYFYTLTAGDYKETKQMLLIK